ncbi:Glutathione oxidoreductase [Komagataella phaffii CBS 7435]|uniref:Glutathione reductase n=3 Tax=Komagataella TaxID=460517 RepID=C4R686_KOMPG|nr:Cytosolic and mitochondrial glutathione oxidoreductase [Komagataella phaffii GS115]AOA64332.1 GQ67_04141T0 [Komagataella phaffii]CAH2449089.1 Glutathione oxidoreductase [Komagataella phaffii CBS 7435]BAH57502.1 glutathione reductase [Komagataella pastoris]AOA68780.1 GQ68_04114T0 [Komagataella phaffii GS115]CAY71072.1 Cytosolic and mitochondrial glutathione oxidoreductase [Komagataella phaffii GS115]
MPSIAQHYKYLVIGGGSGGVASARRAAKHGAKTLLIEGKALGGTCVNVGCVPKKVMWYASDLAGKLSIAKDYGFNVAGDFSFNWTTLKEKRDAYVKRLNGIYERNLEKEGVDYVYGWAKFNPDGKVEVTLHDGKKAVYSADHILIATGGQTALPSEEQITGVKLGIDSDGFFKLEKQPKRVAIVGAGYIGIEFAGVFNGLGSETHLIIRGDTVLRKFDDIIQETVTSYYEKSGINVHKQSQVTKVTKNEDGSLDLLLTTGKTVQVDELIWTIGRKSFLGLGLDNIGVKLNDKNQIIVDEYQRTNVPNVYSLGDVVGNVELTPVAIAAGRKLSNRLFGGDQFKDQKMDYNNVPSVVFSHPESGSIGLTEKQAIERFGKNQIKVYQSKFVSMFYAMSEHKSPIAYKLIVQGDNEKVVGLHIVGDSSAEILQGFGVAIKMGATKADFDNCVAIHPTSAEELVTMV